ncbi:MAG: hypothetical protein QXQ79_00740 [Candidatus Nanoarchaeia archaeon]
MFAPTFAEYVYDANTLSIFEFNDTKNCIYVEWLNYVEEPIEQNLEAINYSKQIEEITSKLEFENKTKTIFPYTYFKQQIKYLYSENKFKVIGETKKLTPAKFMVLVPSEGHYYIYLRCIGPENYTLAYGVISKNKINKTADSNLDKKETIFQKILKLIK